MSDTGKSAASRVEASCVASSSIQDIIKGAKNVSVDKKTKTPRVRSTRISRATQTEKDKSDCLKIDFSEKTPNILTAINYVEDGADYLTDEEDVCSLENESRFDPREPPLFIGVTKFEEMNLKALERFIILNIGQYMSDYLPKKIGCQGKKFRTRYYWYNLERMEDELLTRITTVNKSLRDPEEIKELRKFVSCKMMCLVYSIRPKLKKFLEN